MRRSGERTTLWTNGQARKTKRRAESEERWYGPKDTSRSIPQKYVFPDVETAAEEAGEARLVKASQQGDQEAFALLVQRHQRRVFHLSLRLMQNDEEACEITQEAFLSAWQGLPTFRGDARFSSWLYRITYHCGRVNWRNANARECYKRQCSRSKASERGSRNRAWKRLLSKTSSRHFCVWA
jgi:hypothetical protein